MLRYRVRKYIGAYMALLGRTDAIVFDGGIGEHFDNIRERVCSGLESLGMTLDIETHPPFKVSEIGACVSGQPLRF